MNKDLVWTINSPKRGPKDRQSEGKNRKAGAPYNPAKAFSLSLLVWGGGQIYNRSQKIGVLFLLLMGNFITLLYLILGNLKFVPRYAETTGLGLSGLLAAWCLFLFSGITLWILNAVLAYRQAAVRLDGPYQGIGISLWPAVCSALIPGWGQFLNGQAKKGTIFLTLFAVWVFSIPTILLILFYWSGIPNESERLFWEKFLIGLLVAVGAVIIIWPFVILDAAKVGLDEVKKEPLRKRIEYANNLRRMKGWIGGYFPQAKLTLTLALILGISVAYSYLFFPWQFYSYNLEKLELKLNEQKMVMIPEVIGRVIEISGPVKIIPKKAGNGAKPVEMTPSSPPITFRQIQHIVGVNDKPREPEQALTD
jgi:TM2 domain-containing membrane protein YozV